MKRNQAKKMFEIIVEKEGTEVPWLERSCPTHPEVLGDKATGEDAIASCRHLSGKPEDVEKGLDFDRKLYVARRVFEQSNR